MTLARRLALKIAVLVVSLVLLALASLWGIRGLALNQARWQACDGQLRRLYMIGLDVAAARDLLALPAPAVPAAAARLRSAQSHLELCLEGLPGTEIDPGQLGRQRASGQAALAGLRRAQSMLAAADGPAQTRPADPALLGALHTAQNSIAALSQRTARSIRELQDAGQAHLRSTVAAIGLLSAGVLLAAVLVGWSTYRSVMRPLRRLGAGVRRIAQGHLDQQLAVRGDAEFVALAADFNRMARQLDELYRDLEAKVAAKSRELVRSERLASVGFLAAGVAHEINNPLGIIAGHAELSLRKLPGEGGGAAVDETRASLRVIAEEAFRCKKIVGQLLTLARPGTQGRETVSLAQVARDVAAMVGALPRYRGRRLEVVLPGADPLAVRANAIETRQVLLNLVVNALEATDAGAGRVVIEGGREAGGVRLAVVDNGRGMPPDVLERVFEPFYSQRRGGAAGAGAEDAAAAPGATGTGLGLSIARAIVDGHGGRLTADSGGPGRGSRFTLELPAAAEPGRIGPEEGRHA